VAEIPGHGLTGLPGALKSLADTAPLTETYSNNVGFYKFPFYVSPPLSSTELELPSRGRSTLRLGTVRLSSRKVDLGTDVEVRPTLLTGRNSVPGATVLFYDGDPDEGGRVFDMERVAHLRSYDQHHVRVLFSPDRCGQHQIFVTVSHGKPFERAGKSATLRVTCGNPGDKAPGGHHR
jgi:hypothetical protein